MAHQEGLVFLLLQPAFNAIYLEEENKKNYSQNCDYENTNKCPQVLKQAPKHLDMVGHLSLLSLHRWEFTIPLV